MKNVLHLIKEYKGNYLLLNEYVKALPADRFRSIVCYLSGSPDGKNELESIMSEILYLGHDKRSLKHFNPRIIFSVYKILRRKKIDMVHCHRHKMTVIGSIAASFAGVKNVISHVHGLGRTRSSARRLTNFFIYKIVKTIIAVSDSVRLDIMKSNWRMEPAKVFTVRNSIDIQLIGNIHDSKTDVRARLGISDDKIVFGTVGRLAKTKGHSYLIEAFSEVRKQIPNSRLVIIGDGPLAGELTKKSKDLGISKHVKFMGYRTDVLELLKGIDIFVFPSLAEGLPIALLEAMASRLPIIASNVGGIPEVFGNTDCGLLVPPKDSHVLAEAMIEIGSLNDDKRKFMGNIARKRIEEAFTTEMMCKGLRDIYESVIST